MAGRNGELVPDNWSLVRKRALTTGLCSEALINAINKRAFRLLPRRLETVFYSTV